jgi:Ca2+-transporting ATPase
MTAKEPTHARTGEAILNEFKVDLGVGLSLKEVLVRQKQYGKNILKDGNRITVWGKIKSQLKSPLVIILIVAGVITIVLGEYLDAIVIFSAILINVLISVIQEGRASKAFDTLAESQEKYTTVIRDERKVVVLTGELVPGDIVVLEAGAFVPADIRVINSNGLLTNEASLTGEWFSVSKTPEKVSAEVPLAEQSCMVFMGTLVASGNGVGVVTAIATETEFGKIAESIVGTIDPITPIQKSLKRLANFLSVFVGILVIGIFILGILRGEQFVEMVVLAIAIAVSVLPEGLPATVTVVLAVGMERILSKGGLVRSLLAAETLGSTTIILTDKTGTLTQAKMKLNEMLPSSAVVGDSEDVIKKDIQDALTMAVLASDAFVEREAGQSGEIVVRGRPIEQAIIHAGLEAGLSQKELEKELPQIGFLPFSPETRFAGSLNRGEGKSLGRIHITGAPEIILKLATHTLRKGIKERITPELREKLIQTQIKQGQQGKRLIAVAYKDTKADELFGLDEKKKQEKQFSNLTFAAFLVFEDPIRDDVVDAIKKSRSAGARVIMLTGDNQETARAIAIEAGIAKQGALVCSGSKIDGMSDKELRDQLKRKNIFARVLPRQKLRIARILKEDGEVVAMTGDGVNDAPALRRADIGIAVGTGTEVAKEASDLILLNNSFSIIVSAIEEGRRIIDNLKKIVSHLLATSFSEVFIVIGALLFGFPLPILAVQILWLNIIEEGLISFAFAFEPAEEGIMKRNPRENSAKRILTPALKKIIFITGTVTGIAAFALLLLLRELNLSIEEMRTIMFVALTLDTILFSLALKNMHMPFWKIKVFSNRYMIVALVVSIFALVLTFVIPGIRTLLSLTTLPLVSVPILISVAIINLLTIEWVKSLVFWGEKNIEV